ncbi:MAG: hypothetical protein DPW18_19560 [Chloroflexi bacterium]|nr:hypothetical protein [Chloroflexota bacterium]MDL1943231.1 diguanylate cyclase [Chloroflexi bacterium CFX2]
MQDLVRKSAADETLRASTAHIAILNSHGEIIAVNELWKQFARENGGTDTGYFIGVNYLGVCKQASDSGEDSGTAGTAYRGLQAILRREQSEFSMEYPCHSPSVKRWFIMQAVGFAVSGEFIVVVTHEDITRFKNALQDAQSRFNIFVQSLPDVVYTLNMEERRVTGFNRDSFLGYSYEELAVEGSIQNHIHPEDAEAVAVYWQNVMKGDNTESIEYRVQNKAGHWEWVDSRKTFITRNPDGTPKEMMVILRVITDRKEAEEKIAYQARVLENVNDVIIGTDENFFITYWNPAAERIFGWKSGEVIGKSAMDILQTKFSEGGLEDSIREVKETGTWKGEVTQFTRDNRPIPIDANIMTLRNAMGKITGFVSANRDITKRKEVEAILLQAKEAIEASNLELRKALSREQLLARTDSLTGIFNRRHFFSLAEHEFSVIERYRMQASVVIFDIDHFKQVNDRWGHHVGDDVLRHVSNIAHVQVRAADILARYGGEEFIVFLPNSSADEAAHVAERIRRNVMSYRIDPEHTQAYITVSMGIAERTAETTSLDHLIRHADRALYDAKEAGRNCVRIYKGSR